jgi:tRNA C32,U32 (ribose-2'-O)-methylase TrmJ
VCSSWFVNEISIASRGDLEKLSSVETVRLLSPELRRQFRADVRRLAQVISVPENKRNGIEETLTRVILRGMPKDDEISRILGVINKATQAFEEE